MTLLKQIAAARRAAFREAKDPSVPMVAMFAPRLWKRGNI